MANDLPTREQAEAIVNCKDWEAFGFQSKEEFEWLKMKAEEMLNNGKD